MHNDETFESNYGASADECYSMTLALVNQFSPGYFDAIEASVAAGRIVYNGDDADVCNGAVDDASCDAFFEQNGMTITEPAECATALVGTVADGGACTLDEDCVGGNCPDGTCSPG